MRKTWLFAVMLVVAGCQKPAGGGGTSGAGATPQTEDQKTLYALGLSIGRSISVFNLTPEELQYVQAGMNAQVKGEKPAVELEAYGPKFQQLAQSRARPRPWRRRRRPRRSWTRPPRSPAPRSCPSGLIYKELKAGTGASPKPTDS